MQVKGIKGWRDPHVRAKPVPPVEVYDEWLRRPTNRRVITHGTHMSITEITGAKLRRVVIMRRQGASWKECQDAIGRRSSIRHLFEMMPMEMQP